MANKRISELSSRTPSATDLMLIGDPTTGYSYKCTLLETIGLGVPATRTITINGTTFDLSANRTWNVGTVTSVGLSMPSAFTVSGSPVTNNGTLTVTAAGTASQYIRGDGQLATLPTGGGGGGASVSYYLNGSVNQGTFGGTTYYEVNKTPVLGTGTNFTTSSNGYIASFITDAGDPGSLLIPGGNWNFEVFFAASSGGGTPTYYVELYKYDGTTFSLIASSSPNPDVISGGTAVEAYFSTLAVPETPLAITDRLAIRIYVTTAGRTITLHTEDNNLCQIITTFSTGITALNGLTRQVQYFATGTAGTNFNIVSSGDTHTFNLPSSSATNRGLLTAADWTTFNGKQNALNGTGFVRMTGTTVSYITGTSSQFVKADGTLDSSVYVTSNIYTADGTLTGNRTVTLNGNTLTFANGSSNSIYTALSNTSRYTLNATQFSEIIFRANSVDRGFVAGNFTGEFALGSLGGSFVTFYTSPSNVLTERMRIHSNGNIAINTTTDAGFRLDVAGTLRAQNFTTINATTAVNGDVSLVVNTTTNNSAGGQMWGIRSIATAATNTGNINGIDSAITNSSSSASMLGFNSAVNINANTTSVAKGYNVGGAVTGTGIASNYIGYDYLDVFKAGSGAVTRQFGMRIASLAAGSNANVGLLFNNSSNTAVNGNWDIYAQSGNNSYFAGNIGIGTTSPTYKLHTVGTGRITGNVELSVDSGAYTIIGATGDTTYRLSVDGGLRVYGSIRTAQPTGGTGIGVWRLGSTATGTFTLDTALCVEIEIGGTLYRLATVDPA